MKSFKKFIKEININNDNINIYFDELVNYLNSCFCMETINYIEKNNIDKTNLINYIKNNKCKIKYQEVILYYLIEDKYDEIYNKYYFLFDKLNLNIEIINKIHILAEDIYETLRRINLTLDELLEDNYFYFLYYMVSELCNYEKVNLFDIKFLGFGSTSSIFQIGNKIFKIGSERVTFNVENNKRFLKPLYRDYVCDDKDNFVFCVEITEAVSTKDINEQDVYNLYKELRDNGFIWIDYSKDNIGRLVRDNKIYFRNINHVSKNSTNYLTENEEILKKNDLVILDNDYIYPEKDFINFSVYDSMEQYNNTDEFAKRYVLEKRVKK